LQAAHNALIAAINAGRTGTELDDLYDDLKPLSYSPAAASPPAEFEAEGTDGQLVRVGPTLHGWVYRSAAGTAVYRVYPIDALPVPWRQEVRERAHTSGERHGPMACCSRSA